GSGTDTINLTSTAPGLNALSDAALQGVDKVSATHTTSNVVVDLHSQTEGFTIAGGDFKNEITGGAGDDTLIGGAGADFLHGGHGFDTLYGDQALIDPTKPEVGHLTLTQDDIADFSGNFADYRIVELTGGRLQIEHTVGGITSDQIDTLQDIK